MPATTAYGVDLLLELGVGRQSGAGRWDESRWDDAVWGASDTALGDWVDVTCDVADRFTLAAGTSDAVGVVTRWEAATTALTLWADDRNVWDPWSGPYAGVLGSQVPLRWRWRPTGELEWLPLFTGQVIDGGWDWDPNTAQVKVTASDATSDLVGFQGVEQAKDVGLGAGETATARVTRILDNARTPAAARNIITGPGIPAGVTLVATTLKDKAWDELLAVADTDAALLWVDRAGRVSYQSGGRVSPALPVATLLACPDPRYPDGLQVVDMGRADPTPVVNIAAVRGGTPPGQDQVGPPYAQAEDSGSVARFRARRQTFDLLHDAAANPDWSATIAALVVQGQAFPSTAPRQVTLGLASGDPRVPIALFTVDVGTAFATLDPAGTLWVTEVAGWDVQVGWDICGGVLNISDVSRWTGGRWDIGVWDTARWGL